MAVSPQEKVEIAPPHEIIRMATATASEVEDGVVEFSISSDGPIVGIWGEREILDHSPGAIDLTRVESGAAPLLYNHGEHPQLGTLVKGWIDRGKLRLRAVWDTEDPEVKPFYEKYKRGFLTSTSVRARVLEAKRGQDAGGEYTKITRWELIEASFATVPADASVGVGRSLYQGSIEKSCVGEIMPPDVLESESPPVDLEVIRQEAQNLERDRIRSITALGEKYKNTELAAKLIQDGAVFDVARNAFSDYVFENLKAEAEKPAATLGLSSRENKQYSILRAIYAAKTGNWANAGLELEVSQTIAAQKGETFDQSSGKFHLPGADLTIEREFAEATRDVKRAALAGQANNVATLVTEDFRGRDLISLGYDSSLLNQLGITFLRNLKGTPIRMPRQTAGLGFNWRTEQGALTESNLAFNDVSMTPKEFGGMFLYSYLAAHQADIPMGLEAFARMDFAKALGEFYTITLLRGSGAAGPPAIPRGLLNVSGMNTVTRPANGGTLDPDVIKDLVLPALRTKLVSRDELTVLSTLNYCNWLSKQKDTQGRYIWLPQDSGTIGSAYPRQLWNMPLFESVHMPENLTKGTGVNLSALLVGPFSRGVIVGEWYNLMIDTSKDFRFDTGLETVRILGNMDVINRLPDCFGIVNDIVTV